MVSGVALVSGGDLLATAGDDHLARLWNVHNGQLLRTLSGHSDWVRRVSLGPDGRIAATAGTDRQIRLWRTKSGEAYYATAEHAEGIRASVQPGQPALGRRRISERVVRVYGLPQRLAGAIAGGPGRRGPRVGVLDPTAGISRGPDRAARSASADIAALSGPARCRLSGENANARTSPAGASSERSSDPSRQS